MEKTVKLLVVDDEYINLRLFELNFGKKYKVITATNGQHALELLQQNHDVHIVITDLKMPGMNGLEFAHTAKQLHPEIMFLLLTGFEISAEVERALDKGLLLKYFCKPLDVEDMEQTLESLL
jgi:two-component system, response regulator, stage 0 sporulation protein F